MTSTVDERLERIAAGVATLRLGSKLSESAIDEIERLYSISLPSDYRRFLEVVGNGGCGPGSGLQRFGYVDASRALPPVTEDDDIGYACFEAAVEEALLDHRRPSDPFTLTEPLIAAEMFEGLCDDRTLSPFVRPMEFIRSAAPNGGTWLLAKFGCAIQARLVLNGTQAGQVWLEDPDVGVYADAKAYHQVFEMGELADSTFLSWYEHWLLRVEKGDLIVEEIVGDIWQAVSPPPPVRTLIKRATDRDRERATKETRLENLHRRDHDRPALELSSKTILERVPDPRDGLMLHGVCPRCRSEGPLRVIERTIVLCRSCWRAW